jgi:CRISPR-associated protein Cas1
LEKTGFSKGTLHYMKQNTKSDKLFMLNSHVLERVKAWENLVSGARLRFNIVLNFKIRGKGG